MHHDQQFGDFDGSLKMDVYKKGDWTKITLIDNVIHGHSLQLTDMNNNSNLIFVSEMRHDSKNPQASIKVLYFMVTVKEITSRRSESVRRYRYSFKTQ